MIVGLTAAVLLGAFPMLGTGWTADEFMATAVGLGEGYSGDGGPAVDAGLDGPRMIAFDRKGGYYIADAYNQVIRHVDAAGTISNFAGTPRQAGFRDGPAGQALFNTPHSVDIDRDGNVIVGDPVNDRVRKIDVNTKMVTTIAGIGQTGYAGDGGPATQARLSDSKIALVGPDGGIYIDDMGNDVIRRIDPVTGNIETWAGQKGVLGGADGIDARQSGFSPRNIVFDIDNDLIIADRDGNKIRSVDWETRIISTIAGSGVLGPGGDGGPALEAELNAPRGLGVDWMGNVYIADSENNRVRKVDIETGIMTTVAGSPTSQQGRKDGTVDVALLANPRHAIFDDAGNFYITDTGNSRIRFIANFIAPKPAQAPAPAPAPAPQAPSQPAVPVQPNQVPDGPAAQPTASRSGYWMLGTDGRVYSFGHAESHGDAPATAGRSVEAADLEPTASGKGYWVVDSTGRVSTHGDALALGSVEPGRLVAGETVTSLSATPSGRGYWIFTTKGRTVAFGDARHFGDMAAQKLNGPVLDSIPTPSGQGYYMVASDGGIFSFGDAALLRLHGRQDAQRPGAVAGARRRRGRLLAGGGGRRRVLLRRPLPGLHGGDQAQQAHHRHGALRQRLSDGRAGRRHLQLLRPSLLRIARRPPTGGSDRGRRRPGHRLGARDRGEAAMDTYRNPTSARRRRHGGAWLAGSLVAGLLVSGTLPSSAGTADVTATAAVETTPSDKTGDSVDDMAIWVDTADPTRSVVIGADHSSHTIDVYDLAGTRLQHLDLGDANNVDLRTGFSLGGTTIDLVGMAGGGHSGGGALRFFRIDPATRNLENVTVGGEFSVPSAHGFCMYHSATSGKFYAFRLAPSGIVQQFELFDDGGKVNARAAGAQFDVEPRPINANSNDAIEGCTTDDDNGSLFIGEQDWGIWKYSAEPADPRTPADRVLVDGTDTNGGHITADVEGLAIVEQPGGGGFLLASSQGDDSFNVYRRQAPHEFVRKVRVVAGPQSDGCERTDGIEAVAANLGPAFPHGLFVCQDNGNSNPAPGNQNFKYVGLDQVVPLSDGAPVTPPPPPPPDPPSGPTPGPDPGTTPPVAAPDPTPRASGYWMLGSTGQVYAFGDARVLGQPAVHKPNRAVDLEPTPSGQGYWVVDATGAVSTHGDATQLGSLAAGTLAPGEQVTSLSSLPSGRGYWLFTNLGRVVPFGAAADLGDMSGSPAERARPRLHRHPERGRLLHGRLRRRHLLLRRRQVLRLHGGHEAQRPGPVARTRR